MEAFAGRCLQDFGAALSAAVALLGDQLGIYRAMADGQPVGATELAQRCGLGERHVREWLLNQVASGYVEHDEASGTYKLPPEHAVPLTDESSPFFVGGGFAAVAALTRAQPRLAELYRSGGGMLWGEHDPLLFDATERFFRPAYLTHLVAEWIPAIEGLQARLERGGKVADVGCGHGASTVVMARAFPRSSFFGYDNHEPSIERARAAAEAAGVADRTRFVPCRAQEIPDDGFDLIAFFDCLHDMGDPVGALTRARAALADGGAVMAVEPMAGDTVGSNANPIGRVYSGASVLCCTPNALASGGTALGTCAPDSSIEAVAREAGFSRFRRAADTPFNRVFEMRA